MQRPDEIVNCGQNVLSRNKKPGIAAIIGPGLLVAATGVGVGDLATASFAGSILGTAIIWATVVGAFFKYVINEGLARWQLATGSTLVEGVVGKFGKTVGWMFVPYLLFWTFFVGSSQMSGSGVTLHAMIPIFDDASTGKVVFGALSSVVVMALVLIGGYRLFDKIMRVCIAIMYITVVLTAALLWPGTTEVLQGLLVPRIPDIDGVGLTWTVALLGGIGGTVTILCYGYWIREEGRTSADKMRTCRIDLGVAYLSTAIFGISMVIIGSNIEIEGGGATLIVRLAEQLEAPLGMFGKWLFLIGASGAVFSSMLGVWQAVPYIFADIWTLVRSTAGAADSDFSERRVDTSSGPYKTYLAIIGFVPMIGLFVSFQEIQKTYAVVGSSFIPLLTFALIFLNGRSEWVGIKFRNRPATVLALLIILAFFAWAVWRTVL